MRPIIAALMLVLMPAVAQTHHWTRAFYDRGASAQIEGVITSVFWRNPHVGLTLLVRNEQGEQEEWDAVRTIYMTDTASPQDTNSSRLGYSLGTWDTDTLIVRTSHVEAPYLDDSGTPMSTAAQMIVRFSLRGDEGRLDYEVTVIDPAYLVEPAVWNAAWVWRPGITIQTFDCALN